MRKLFLNSSLGTSEEVNGINVACKINNENNLIECTKKYLEKEELVLWFPSNPEDVAFNKEKTQIVEKSLNLSGFKFKEFIEISKSNEFDIEELLKRADLIILSGGHVLTQNKWFSKINLKEHLKNYNGVIWGVSAGSMNTASVVYNAPELDGEAIDPNFKRWIEGLDLTNINVFPHYSYLVNEVLDGLKVIDDIVLKDSFKCPIYAINDGSFIEVLDNEAIIHGECFKIFEGNLKKISGKIE